LAAWETLQLFHENRRLAVLLGAWSRSGKAGNSDYRKGRL